MTADPYYIPAFDDPDAKRRALEADRNHWRVRAIAAEAEVARMETAACSALIHDCRGGRVGWPWFARVLFGAGVR